MKKIIAFISLYFLTVSCSPFIANVRVENVHPPFPENTAVYFYVPKEDLPDSAEFVGVISNYKAKDFVRSATTALFIDALEEEARSSGANLIQMLPINEEESSQAEIARGKLYRVKPYERITIDWDSLTKAWKNRQLDENEGMYETDLEFAGSSYANKYLRYAVIKRKDDGYDMIYIRGFELLKNPLSILFDPKRIWKRGDVFARLSKSDNSRMFRTTYYSIFNKDIREKSVVKFNAGNMRHYLEGGYIDMYQRVFPDTAEAQWLKGSLTGFAVNANRIMTCYHGVADKNTKIIIRGIHNDFDKKYEAVVEKFDKIRDIAVLKLKDSTVNLGNNPFLLKDIESNVGEEVLAMGYPMSLLMGEEIKLSNGIISAMSGFAGDLSNYQFSAPIQPGNSGSPLLDKEGNLIGLINAKITRAENVGYALKGKFLKDFLVSSGYTSMFSSNNTLSGLNVKDKVASLQKSIYIIEILDKKKDPIEKEVGKSGLR